jgi:S1-C subfamily serine protease
LRRGDVVLGVAGQTVSGQRAFYQTLWAIAPDGDPIELHILRSKSVQYVKIRPVDRAAYLRWRAAS